MTRTKKAALRAAADRNAKEDLASEAVEVDDRAPDAHSNNYKEEKAFSGSARAKKYAIHPLKSQIRDLQRLLSNVTDMPAGIRADRERELEALKHDLVIQAAKKEKQDMIGKYHMVRFFERKKAERGLKKCKTALNNFSDSEVPPKLAEKVHMAQIDLNYTLYFPLNRPYVSLYPKTKSKDGKIHSDDKAIEEGLRGDPVLWKLVETATKEGNLDALRNGLDLERARETVLTFRPQSDTSAPKTEETSKKPRSGPSGVVTNDTEDADVEMDLDPEGGVEVDTQTSYGIAQEGGFFEQ